MNAMMMMMMMIMKMMERTKINYKFDARIEIKKKMRDEEVKELIEYKIKSNKTNHKNVDGLTYKQSLV